MALIFAAPQFSRVSVGGHDVTAFDLQTALNKARPGDIVRLLEGVYRVPVTVTTSGRIGAPITVEGPETGEAVFDGGRSPADGFYGSRWPMDGTWAFMKMFGVANFIVDRVTFRNCWPAVFYLRGCEEVTFRRLRGVGGRHVVYARNFAERLSRGFLLEQISWTQDPDFDMWEGRAKWREVKQRTGYADKSWFNGALFESYDIGGDVVIRHCDVSHAFNAIRMDIAEGRVSLSRGKPVVSRNRNVRIYGNRFSYIRDNAIEPERGLHGWLVAENLFFQVHAALSSDAVVVRDGTFVSNRFLNLSRPGDESNTGGKIIKFLDWQDPKESPPCWGFTTAFNSARTRTRYVSDAKLKSWSDANNAVERFAASAKDDAALFSNIIWSAEARTDSLATNDSAWPAKYAAEGANVGGWPHVETVFDFTDPAPDISSPLGGWSGELPLSSETSALRSAPIRVYGPNGLSHDIAAGGAVGYRSLSDLGLGGWL